MNLDAEPLTPEERALIIGLTVPIRNTNGEADALGQLIKEHIRAAVAEEREACAKIAESHDESEEDLVAGVDTGRIWWSAGARNIAAAIRMRANAH